MCSKRVCQLPLRMRCPTRAEVGGTLGAVLITGFATGAAETNCYLVAPRAGGAALVIDPGEDAVPTLEYYFAVNELSPAAVLLTSGRREVTGSAFDLCAGWDIPVYLHPADRDLLTDPPEILRDLTDGEIRLAEIVVHVDHTPGHTAGSLVYRVLADTDEGPATVAFTGHTLGFRTVGGPGCDSDRRQLLRSIREKLLVLDDDTVVLPAHGTSTTIGDERRHNKHLDA
ncbi:metallo-beta-lactamase superfamily protein [Mycolicibacterium chitae]|uniref:Metallo-beta-lactamase superfamily protein n=2 Tax=Mycobacteriaceae TaxID=1762 RepID=A0A448I7I1_MYCCI|nr:metallo-beta-lactamase superfamily protein [Mycolicibacterium chitae]